MYLFINGGAGVGKSRLIKAINQTLIRHENRIPGHNPDNISVLITAYTGKAANLIGGMTLHHVFKMGFGNQQLIRLGASTLNTLR